MRMRVDKSGDDRHTGGIEHDRVLRRLHRLPERVSRAGIDDASLKRCDRAVADPLERPLLFAASRTRPGAGEQLARVEHDEIGGNHWESIAARRAVTAASVSPLTATRLLRDRC